MDDGAGVMLAGQNAPGERKVDSASRPAAVGALAAPASTTTTASVKPTLASLRAPPPTENAGPSYKIGPQDVLDVTVFQVADLSRTYSVSDVGTLSMPLVGEIHVGGRSTVDVEREIAQRLGARYLQSPQVTVSVKEYNSQRITIEGSVKKPGVYPIRGRTTLLQAIAIAQGIEANAESDAVIIRQTAGKRLGAKFDLTAIRSGEAEDPVLVQGDVVIVNESVAKTAFNNLMKAVPLTNLFVPLL